MARFWDDAEHRWLPDASDRPTRYALSYALDALEDWANTEELEHLESAEEFLKLAAPGVMTDLGVI